MNKYILPRFGNRPIRSIDFLDVKKFITTFECSAKRVNNILVPLRSLFKFALLAGIIEKNPMDMIANLKIVKPDIHPLSIEVVRLFLKHVRPEYHDFFVVAFFTGMRFGKMAALKWKNMDFNHGIIKVRETRVADEEGRPKTRGSVRDIKMLPPVEEAMRRQDKVNAGRLTFSSTSMTGRSTPLGKPMGLEARP